MSETISQRELRNASGEVMRRVEGGESFIVTRRGVPVADLVPHQDRPGARPRFVDAATVVALMAGLPDWGVGAFERESRELDEYLDDRPVDRWPSA